MPLAVHSSPRRPAFGGLRPRTPLGRRFGFSGLPSRERNTGGPRPLGVLAAAALLSLLATGCGVDAADDDAPERRAFPLDGRTLTVEVDQSAVELVPADVEKVEVTRWFSGWSVAGDAERSWSMKDGTLRLRVDCEGPLSSCDVRHRVKVPEGTAVTVRSDDGSITATGFTTALKLRSDNGAVRVEDAGGPLEIGSDNGSVSATGVASRRVTADSDNGSVELAFTRVPDRVEGASDNGRVQVDLPRAAYRVTAESDNGDVEVGVDRDAASGHVIDVRSRNGSVTLREADR